MSIKYVKGDATNPQGPNRLRIIAHCCNDLGVWGAGFVLALNKTYPEVEETYLSWFDKSSPELLGKDDFMGTKPRLGGVLWVATGKSVHSENTNNYINTVYHIIGQHGVGRDRDGNPPIRYEAIEEGLEQLSKLCTHLNVMNSDPNLTSVHMPRMGCGLAGGNWMRIQCLINKHLISKGIQVTVYDLP